MTPKDSWNKVTGLTSLTDRVLKDLKIWGTKENMVRVAAVAPIIVQSIIDNYNSKSLINKGVFT
ncbi:MAG: hypothetical protein Q8N80_05630 [Candidatus Omnitrophota bacterium]|nr:hypothetical protein [Candidatus Omnitrophota bacterium]